MTENKAITKKSKKISIVWIIPFITLIISAILIWNNSFNKGSQITVSIIDADGIEAGKTLVKLHSVTIGKVTQVSLDENFNSAILTIQMNKGTDSLLRSDTLFWVVKTRVRGIDISGLDTLLSGAYIQCEVGNDPTYSRSFKALETPPVTKPNVQGVNLNLQYKGTKTLVTGDPVLYKGFSVGNILSSEFDIDNNLVKHTIFIQDPYAKLLTNSTRFWVSSGIDFSLNTSGLTVETESLNNLLQGSISFDNFSSYSSGSISLEKPFTVFDSKKSAYLDYLSLYPSYVSFINYDFKGIVEGSKIYYKGLHVGTVIKSPFINSFDYVLTSKLKPILIAFHADDVSIDSFKQYIDKSIKSNKLCLEIDSSSLLSSNDQLNLIDIKNKNCKLAKRNYLGYSTIAFSDINQDIQGLNTIVAKIDAIDTKGISDELKQTLNNISLLANNLAQNSKAINNADLINKMANAVERLDTTLQSFDKNSQIYDELNIVLQRVNKLLNDLGPGLNAIGQNPNSIIFGNKTEDYEPKKAIK